MKKALVCGAGGFIGSHLVKRLKKSGYWVRGADRKKPEFSETAADDFLLLDLREQDNCEKALSISDGAGFDEVYDNIGEDQFLLTVQKEGSGSGFVFSDPLGISCGTDCTEVVFNGTLVTLSATPLSGSEFIGWSGCPLVNGSDQCLISVTESATVFAEFQPDDLIFSNGFE